VCEALGEVPVFQYRITEEEHVMSRVHIGRDYFELLSDNNRLKGPKSVSNSFKTYSAF